MRFRFAVSKLVLAFASMFLARECPANVVYSNLNSPLYLAGTDVVGATAAGEFEIAPPYVAKNGQQISEAGGNFAVTSVTVGMYYVPVQPGFTASPTDTFSPDFDIWIYSNYQYAYQLRGVVYYYNQPEAPLEEVGHGLIAPNDLGLVTANSSVGTTMLGAGDLYWIVLTPANSDTLVTWGAVNTGQSLKVDGRQITPEPCTFAFVILAGGGALALAWKRRTAAFDLL